MEFLNHLLVGINKENPTAIEPVRSDELFIPPPTLLQQQTTRHIPVIRWKLQIGRIPLVLIELP